MTKLTVSQYVAKRFVALGIKHVFGVPGDYSFPIDNALEKAMTWVGCANELNAGYAADGYARTHGVSLLCTTYGVGELSALNAMMGAYAERVPVFHLVGIPGKRLQRSHQLLHHSLGDGEFSRFFQLSAGAACASALLTPENVVAEMDRVIHAVLLERRPGYLALPADYAVMSVNASSTLNEAHSKRAPRKSTFSFSSTRTILKKNSKKGEIKNDLFYSEPRELAAATKQIVQRLAVAKNPIILPAYTIGRYGLQKELQKLLKVSGIPYATMLMDKAVVSESHHSYLGMYRGASSEPSVQEAVESADLILNIGGALFSDLSTGFFSHKVKVENMITIWPDFVEMGDTSKTYGPIMLQDSLISLNQAFQNGQLQKKKKRKNTVPIFPIKKILGKKQERVTHESFYDRLARFLEPKDQIIVESGFTMFEMGGVRLPADARLYHQSLWGSVGWATPALLGVALAKASEANAKGRMILLTGDGAHQFTANELGTIGRWNLKPLIFVMNDGAYAIEEFLDQNKRHLYNKLSPWSYAELPKVMGCHDWLTMQIKTNAELDQALKKAARSQSGCYFEILLGSDLRPPASEAMTETFYQKLPPL